MNEIGTISSFWILLDLGPLASGSLASGLLSRFHHSMISPFITQSYLAARDSCPSSSFLSWWFSVNQKWKELVGNWAGPISCLQIQGPIWPETQYSICFFRMLWENYSRRAKVVSLEEQLGRLPWATVDNILLVGWIVTRTSAIESRQKVHSVRFSSTRDTCRAVFCTPSALTFISPTNLVDGPWLWVPILLSHRYCSSHRGANTTGETPCSI